MTYEPFDVVVVPFPFTDRNAWKRRPALVVSSPLFNDRHRHLLLAMVTSTVSEWPSDVPVAAWQAANLTMPSKIRFKLFTLDRGLIVRKLGKLAASDRKAVREALRLAVAIG